MLSCKYELFEIVLNLFRNKELSEQQLSGCGDELCARDYLLIPGGTGVLPGTEASVQSKDKKKLESRDRYNSIATHRKILSKS